MEYDFPKITKYLNDSQILLSIACMFGLTAKIVKDLFKDRLRYSEENILFINDEYKSTFGNREPNCCNINNCKELMELFEIDKSHSEKILDEMMSINNRSSQQKSYSGPDVGFAFNSDGSKCAVLLPNSYLSTFELTKLFHLPQADLSGKAILNIEENPESIDGIRQMLSLLTILSSNDQKNLSPEKIIANYFSRLSFQGIVRKFEKEEKEIRAEKETTKLLKKLFSDYTLHSVGVGSDYRSRKLRSI